METFKVGAASIVRRECEAGGIVYEAADKWIRALGELTENASSEGADEVVYVLPPLFIESMVLSGKAEARAFA